MLARDAEPLKGDVPKSQYTPTVGSDTPKIPKIEAVHTVVAAKSEIHDRWTRGLNFHQNYAATTVIMMQSSFVYKRILRQARPRLSNLLRNQKTTVTLSLNHKSDNTFHSALANHSNQLPIKLRRRNHNQRNLHFTVASQSINPAMRFAAITSSGDLTDGFDYDERADEMHVPRNNGFSRLEEPQQHTILSPSPFTPAPTPQAPPLSPSREPHPAKEQIWWDNPGVDALDGFLGEEDIGIDEEQEEEEEEEEAYHEPMELPTTKDNAVENDEEKTIETNNKKSIHELLGTFDRDNPPETDDPEEIQRWLECESYQESAEKYQTIISDLRKRRHYESMPTIQRQIVHWFPNLESEYASMQKDYLLKKHGEFLKSETCFGPYLCALSPAKLAVIVSQETLLMCLRERRTGAKFVALTKRLGEAVEEEVLIERVLYKQAQARKAAKLKIQPDGNSNDSEYNAEEDEYDDSNHEFATGHDAEHTGGDSRAAQEDVVKAPWTYAASHLDKFLKDLVVFDPGTNHKNSRNFQAALRRTRKVLENEEPWSDTRKVQLGAALVHVLLEHATIRVDGNEEMALKYEVRWIERLKRQGFVEINEAFAEMVTTDEVLSFVKVTNRFKPMVVPPATWTSPVHGGYLLLKTELMRCHGCRTQEEVLNTGDLTTLLDGLNVLGAVPWRINERILDVALQCWDKGIELGDIPRQTDFEVPPKPERPNAFIEKGSPGYEEAIEGLKDYTEKLTKYRRMQQKNSDLHSLRCSAVLKLNQAQKFKDFDKIYFPYNVDFRGRAYPVPPHLSNVGSDLCRGMLKFATAKPLGKWGLYWLKVHLANLAGKDKVTFDERAAFTEENMAKVRESAENPFGGEMWWMGLDEPFQGLSTCIEIINAIDSGDAESYMCSLPVHMDGSCNGLQHYAALGRDPVGGKAVNLCATDKPQDVYAGVMHEVIKRVHAEANRSLDFETTDPSKLSKDQLKELKHNKAAKLVDGLIDRGVVKRTVMTNVYGVTYIGARAQIQEKIEEKLEEAGEDIDLMSTEIFSACGYLASVTMDVMGDLFTGARGTMNWLASCARLMSHHGYPVAWISPIGVPVCQPYRRTKESTVVTLRQSVRLNENLDDYPIHKQRQVTAFPPNYVHSLDSSHMLLVSDDRIQFDYS